MKKKKEREEELRQRVLNDAQFADYAIKEYNQHIEKIREPSSKNSSTKDICELQIYENSCENINQNASDCSNQYYNDVSMMNSQVYYQPQ